MRKSVGEGTGSGTLRLDAMESSFDSLFETRDSMRQCLGLIGDVIDKGLGYFKMVEDKED